LLGEATLDEAVDAGRQATRRYAKRQYTWFAHQPPAEWPRFREALDVDRLADALALLELTS
jgi:tRNA dimethylallyltransferase